MVPMLTCGLVRWNLAFATGVSSLRSFPHRRWGQALTRAAWFSRRYFWLFAACLGDDLLGNAGRNLGIRVELHAVVRPPLRPAAQVAHVAEHLRQRDKGLHDPHP